jgi:tRNA modification GTPase
MTKSDLESKSAATRLATSAVTGEGVYALREKLFEIAREHKREPLAPSLSRCRHHIDACVYSLGRAHTLAVASEMPELLALAIREALEELGELTGAIYTDDLLDRIFNRFCIGK